MNSNKPTGGYSNRPAYIAGLYFFMLSACTVISQGHSFPGVLKHHSAHNPENLLDLPENSQVHFRSTYNPLYSEKNRSSDSESAVIRTGGAYAGWFSGGSAVKYYLSCAHDDGRVKYSHQDKNYLFENQRDEWRASSGISYQGKNTIIGFGLGRCWLSSGASENANEPHNSPPGYSLGEPWRLSFAAEAAFLKATARLSLFSGPVYSSLSRLSTSDENSYRMFPISLMEHKVETGIDIGTRPLSLSFTFGFNSYENTDQQTVPNRMPQDVKISQYRLLHRGSLTVPFTDSLWWSLNGSAAGGWVASYNFDRDRYTFFKSDSLMLTMLDIRAGGKLPCNVNAGITQSFLKGSSPSGFLKLSALSAWSVFKPLDYRYSSAEVTYMESGCFVNRTFNWGFLDIDSWIYVSYIKTGMKVTYSHKEIVVLLPVYVNPVDREMFENRILLIKPAVSLLADLGSIHLKGRVEQMIPCNIQDNGRDDTETGNSGKKIPLNKRTGGTMLSVSAVWYMPDCR